MYQKDCDRDKHTNALLDDMKLIKERYVDKNTFKPVLDEIKEIKDKLNQHNQKFNYSSKNFRFI